MYTKTMDNNNNKIRIIFGLKIRQLRMQKGLGLQDIANEVGFSISYLNEIEKGKKFPKVDKIMALANCLGVDYDQLVSLKLHNDLEPIADILNSTVLSDLPLDMFGIEASDFVDLMSKAPSKIAAFINTLKEISRTYDIKNIDFFEAVLRSYQEMNDNYFADIELLVQNFRKAHHLENVAVLTTEMLQQLAQHKHNVKITETIDPLYAETDALYRTNYHLILNAQASTGTKLMCLAREIGYQVLNIETRPEICPILKVKSFDHLLHYFKANYFAAALLLNKDVLVGRLTYFLASPKWDASSFLAIKQLFNVENDVFMGRVTSLLSGHFQLNNLFLLGMKHQLATHKVNTTQQMHLRQLHSPHGYAHSEHYCRRWLGLSIFGQLKSYQKELNTTVADCQISEFDGKEHRYFVITVAQWLHAGSQRSDTIGFVIDKNLKATLSFLADPKINVKTVNQTCERCGIANCTERVAAASVYERQLVLQEMYAGVKNLG
jgi:XRE family transcriptional regulator, fatty acid utilization regulator